ncbi:hypothetical protein CRG98_023193 [Punica granatum]|uniref:Uncharacterized protein n=1 Tax=Punica granatum TaxID=22663 RepID=A0A2I0JJK7_PUNGR|nr:hypothetical protein CRG98_023193 [Punica granatum]
MKNAVPIRPYMSSQSQLLFLASLDRFPPKQITQTVEGGMEIEKKERTKENAAAEEPGMMVAATVAIAQDSLAAAVAAGPSPVATGMGEEGLGGRLAFRARERECIALTLIFLQDREDMAEVRVEISTRPDMNQPEILETIGPALSLNQEPSHLLGLLDPAHFEPNPI